MNNTSSINAIVNEAIKNEEEAYEFYKEIASRMTNPAVKEIFSKFASEELEHKKFLITCAHDPKLLSKIEIAEDYQVAQATALPALSIDMKPADAMALAMKKEQQAMDLYEQLAKTATVSTYREMFVKLAQMERGHKVRIEGLFVDIGFPEAF